MFTVNPDNFDVALVDKFNRPLVVVSKTTGAATFVGGRSNGQALAQAAANAGFCSHQVGNADALFRVAANVLVTTATTHSFNVECAYTDHGGTARTLILSFTLVAGAAIVVLVANGAGAVPHHGIPVVIRAKANTTITLRTAAGGTYTTVVYDVAGFIEQLDAA